MPQRAQRSGNSIQTNVRAEVDAALSKQRAEMQESLASLHESFNARLCNYDAGLDRVQNGMLELQQFASQFATKTASFELELLAARVAKLDKRLDDQSLLVHMHKQEVSAKCAEMEKMFRAKCAELDDSRAEIEKRLEDRLAPLSDSHCHTMNELGKMAQMLAGHNLLLDAQREELAVKMDQVDKDRRAGLEFHRDEFHCSLAEAARCHDESTASMIDELESTASMLDSTASKDDVVSACDVEVKFAMDKVAIDSQQEELNARIFALELQHEELSKTMDGKADLSQHEEVRAVISEMGARPETLSKSLDGKADGETFDLVSQTVQSLVERVDDVLANQESARSIEKVFGSAVEKLMADVQMKADRQYVLESLDRKIDRTYADAEYAKKRDFRSTKDKLEALTTPRMTPPVQTGFFFSRLLFVSNDW